MHQYMGSGANLPRFLLHGHVREAMELVRIPLSEDGELLALEHHRERERPIGSYQACQLARVMGLRAP